MPEIQNIVRESIKTSGSPPIDYITIDPIDNISVRTCIYPVKIFSFARCNILNISAFVLMFMKKAEIKCMLFHELHHLTVGDSVNRKLLRSRNFKALLSPPYSPLVGKIPGCKAALNSLYRYMVISANSKNFLIEYRADLMMKELSNKHLAGVSLAKYLSIAQLIYIELLTPEEKGVDFAKQLLENFLQRYNDNIFENTKIILKNESIDYRWSRIYWISYC